LRAGINIPVFAFYNDGEAVYNHSLDSFNKDGAIMSKTITMPTNRGSRIIVEINGVKHIYAAGVQYTVADDIAVVLENFFADPKPAHDQTQEQDIKDLQKQVNKLGSDLGEVSGAVDGLDSRLDALDDETTGAVPALNTRLTALDTPETGAIALLDARVTALEEDDTEPANSQGEG